MQVLHELMSLLNFCKAKKDTPTEEFFSDVSKRQRNPIENFKTQSVRGVEIAVQPWAFHQRPFVFGITFDPGMLKILK
eukprot:UN04985